MATATGAAALTTAEGERYADGVVEPLTAFDGARIALGPADRLRHVRARARTFREEFLDEAPVRFYASRGLVRVPYPRKYGLREACSLPTPLLHLVNRVFVIRFDTGAGPRTLLHSPSDVDANAETPFFKRLATMGPLKYEPIARYGRELLAPRLATVPEVLAALDITPESVDYISYDHLHTQDLRRWLGTAGSPGYFPNARLLVHRQEWATARALLPQQQQWYCPEGTEGIDPAKVVCFDASVRLGTGVALVHTPGHTEGNHSLVCRTPEGIMVSSENGIGADAYAPHASRIPGVARYATVTGMEVVLNGNTLEGAVDQYISMVQEREIAGPSARNPDFPNVVTSSELAPYWAFPGIRPTFSFGDISFGDPATS